MLAASGEDLPATLLQVSRSFLAKVTSPGGIALHRLVAAEAERFPEVGRIFYERAPKRTREIIAPFLAAAMARGQLREADPDAAAGVLLMISMARSHQQSLLGAIPPPSPEQIEADARFAVDIFLRAYAPEPDDRSQAPAGAP
jgi:hypothetical protein